MDGSFVSTGVSTRICLPHPNPLFSSRLRLESRSASESNNPGDRDALSLDRIVLANYVS